MEGLRHPWFAFFTTETLVLKLPRLWVKILIKDHIYQRFIFLKQEITSHWCNQKLIFMIKEHTFHSWKIFRMHHKLIVAAINLTVNHSVKRFMNLNNNSSQFIPKQRVPRRISHSVIGLLHGKRKCCEEKGRQSVSNLLIGTETKMIAKKFNQDNPLTEH